MSFFQSPPPRSRAGHAEFRQPPWLGPGENVIETPVALRVLLAKTERVAIALHSFAACPDGTSFSLTIRARETIDMERLGGSPNLFHLRRPLVAHEELPNSLFRLGVLLGDGRSASNLGGFPRPPHEPECPLLVERGSSGGGGRRWDAGWWLWPLPPPGQLTFICEWPVLDIGETRVQVSTKEIVAAAYEALELWPDDRPYWEPPSPPPFPPAP